MNPNSRLWLCKTKLERDYKNTLTFSSKNAQRNYYIGDPANPSDYGVSSKSYTDFTYLRIENAIKVNDFIENIDTNNYAVVLNNTKYYYYFITSMEYLDEETTKIHIELDVMQTYFFDIVYNNTFIEREHVTDDTRGKHTIPEGLELGEYKMQHGSETLAQLQDIYLFNEFSDKIPVFAVTNLPQSCSSGSGSHIYNGISSGLVYICVENTSINLNTIINDIDNTPNCDIYAIFMAPAKLVNPNKTWDTGNPSAFKYKIVPDSNTFDNLGNISFNKENHLDSSYVPRNNKLLTYPYCYLSISNMAGSVVNYKYEDFTGSYCKFDLEACVSIGCDIRLKPSYLKSSDPLERNFYQNDNFYAIDLYKFPTCGWNNDAYTNWLTQNSVNMTMSTIGTIGSFGIGALGFMTGNPIVGVSGVAGGLNMIKEKMEAKANAKLTPDSASLGSNMGNLNFATNKTFSWAKMTIREEYAQIIDKYFDMFGYKVNILKTPSIHTRRYWNYLKTSGCNFTGNIPQEYITKIKNIFDNGITFWHDPSKMLDYSQTNSILS